jgi:ribosome maturation factor RimP
MGVRLGRATRSDLPADAWQRRIPARLDRAGYTTAQLAGEEVVMNGGSRHGSRGHAKPQGKTARPARPAVPLPDADRLTRLLEPVVHALDLDLETVRVTAAGRRRLLRVIVDGDGGVSLDTIALASRELSARLDTAAEMGELPYTLEVSSPGVDRPLTQPRHWRRALGRLVVAPLAAAAGDRGRDDLAGNGAAPVHGRIAGTSDTGVTLDCDGELREFRYAELGPGRVQIEFGHLEPGDDASADDSGAEED